VKSLPVFFLVGLESELESDYFFIYKELFV